MGELIPIVAILATASVIIAFLNRSRSKAVAAPADNESNLLRRENADLHRTIDRLEARLAVLERIATDPAERTAREIEQLR
jgi:hypothetical protein